MTKVIYSERIGTAKIILAQHDANAYTVTYSDPEVIKSKTINDYSDAITFYDIVCGQTSKEQSATRPMPQQPNFIATINR